jgi:hypothetical protein
MRPCERSSRRSVLTSKRHWLRAMGRMTTYISWWNIPRKSHSLDSSIASRAFPHGGSGNSIPRCPKGIIRESCGRIATLRPPAVERRSRSFGNTLKTNEKCERVALSAVYLRPEGRSFTALLVKGWDNARPRRACLDCSSSAMNSDNPFDLESTPVRHLSP